MTNTIHEYLNFNMDDLQIVFKVNIQIILFGFFIPNTISITSYNIGTRDSEQTRRYSIFVHSIQRLKYTESVDIITETLPMN